MNQELKDKCMEALEEVVDPEIGIDIVNLGLVYGVDMSEEGIVNITMTLTSMGCPMAPQIMQEVRNVLEELEEVQGVNIDLVWTPQWDKSKMTRYGKIALGIHE